MQGTFLRNLALVLVLNLLVKPFYILGIDAGVQVRVGAEAYGGYAALLSLGFLLNILLDLGITNYNTRHISGNIHLMREHVSGILGVRFALILLYGLVTLLVGVALGYHAEALIMLAWLIVNQALVATILYLRSNVAAAQRFARDSLLSVLDRALLIGICGWLLWGRSTGAPFRIEWFVWAQTAAYATTAIVVFVIVRKQAGGLDLKWDPRFSWSILRQSFPYAMLILLMTFYYRTDTIMLERMLPDGALQAGIYAQAFRFFEALNMIGFLMAGLLLPMFSRMLKGNEDVAPLTGSAFRLTWVGTLVLALIGVVYAGDIMALRYDEHIGASASVFMVLMACFMAVCTTYVFGTLLTAAGSLRMLNWMAGVGVLVNIGLNVWLIPIYGPFGAACASLVTQGGTALAQVCMAAQQFRMWPDHRALVRPAIFTVILVGLAWWLHAAGIPIEVGATSLLIVGAGAAALTRTIPLADTWAMIRSRTGQEQG